MGIKQMGVKYLRFDEIAPGRDFHAALAMDFPHRADLVLHTHDFSEAMYVLDGAGTHLLDGEEHALRAGSLLWIRPEDCHAFFVRPGQKLYFVNIAFRQSIWADFRRLALETPDAAPWETAQQPPAQTVPAARRGGCARLFQDTLHSYHTGPIRLDLCRFWSELLPLLLPAAAPAETPPLTDSSPAWLTRACLALHSPESLQAGVPRLVELCGVSPAHLARTLKASSGLTPTEFVNGLRLEQAAILLATTAEEIAEVADFCGFDNLSYFYRLFYRRFDLSPRRYRLSTRQSVLP